MVGLLPFAGDFIILLIKY